MAILFYYQRFCQMAAERKYPKDFVLFLLEMPKAISSKQISAKISNSK